MKTRKPKPKKAKAKAKTGVNKARAKKPPVKKAKKLTAKQEAFVEEYLGNGFNGVQAARNAGYEGNDATLRAIASENLTKPNIASRVRARIEGLAANSNEVLYLLGDHLRADMADLAECFTESGELDLLKARQMGVSHLVKKLKHRRTPLRDSEGKVIDYEHTTEIEMHDSQGAAAKLIPVLGLKQQAAENDRDVARKREWAERKLKEIMAKLDLDEEAAKEWMRTKTPAAAQYLM